jgi:hypothetical protein
MPGKQKVSTELEEIRGKVGRGQENGTLGNVQGNILRGFREEGLGELRRKGIWGKSLIPQPFYPLPVSTEKPSMDPGKTLATLGFMDIFYSPWTVFIFPGRDLLAVYIFVK